MSSIAFGAMVRKRQESDKDHSTTDQPPGLKPYVDALAALVPAEVIAAHQAVLKATTETTKSKTGKDVTTITSPDELEFAFWALIVVSVLFYVAGFQKRRWTLPSVVGAFIPPLAFVAWTMAPDISAFNAAFPDATQAARDTLVIILALVLGLAATGVPAVLNKSPKKA